MTEESLGSRVVLHSNDKHTVEKCERVINELDKSCVQRADQNCELFEFWSHTQNVENCYLIFRDTVVPDALLGQTLKVMKTTCCFSKLFDVPSNIVKIHTGFVPLAKLDSFMQKLSAKTQEFVSRN